MINEAVENLKLWEVKKIISNKYKNPFSVRGSILTTPTKNAYKNYTLISVIGSPMYSIPYSNDTNDFEDEMDRVWVTANLLVRNVGTKRKETLLITRSIGTWGKLYGYFEQDENGKEVFIQGKMYNTLHIEDTVGDGHKERQLTHYQLNQNDEDNFYGFFKKEEE